MDKIILTDLSARGIIGVYPWERQEPQEVRLNLTLETDLHRAGQTDDVADSVDYHALANRLLVYVETAQTETVEALASGLARLCLDDPRVHRVTLRVEKPGALRFAASVGVEIERTRSDFEPGEPG